MKQLLKEIQLDYMAKSLNDVSEATITRCKERVDQIESILIGLDKPQHLVTADSSVKIDKAFEALYPERARDESEYTITHDLAKFLRPLIAFERVNGNFGETVLKARIHIVVDTPTQHSKECYILRSV